ncbi:hypothetical protein EDD22DRAFT_341972 [Suillus occidentalis]|nr:hypothetical protein EDD22DRAFT_341972 [Suillus occidentalis]
MHPTEYDRSTLHCPANARYPVVWMCIYVHEKSLKTSSYRHRSPFHLFSQTSKWPRVSSKQSGSLEGMCHANETAINRDRHTLIRARRLQLLKVVFWIPAPSCLCQCLAMWMLPMSIKPNAFPSGPGTLNFRDTSSQISRVACALPLPYIGSADLPITSSRNKKILMTGFEPASGNRFPLRCANHLLD